jgi:glycerol-3-phosphate dehydrogenase
MGDFLDDTNSIDCGVTVDSISNSLQQFIELTESQKISMIEKGLETCSKYKWDEIAEEYYKQYISLS